MPVERTDNPWCFVNRKSDLLTAFVAPFIRSPNGRFPLTFFFKGHGFIGNAADIDGTGRDTGAVGDVRYEVGRYICPPDRVIVIDAVGGNERRRGVLHLNLHGIGKKSPSDRRGIHARLVAVHAAHIHLRTADHERRTHQIIRRVGGYSLPQFGDNPSPGGECEGESRQKRHAQ